MKLNAMMITATLLATASCAGTSATDTPKPTAPATPTAPAKACLASQPKDIHMWLNSMPGPGASARPPLLASVTMTTPTPGYSFALEVDSVMESYPEQVILDLIVTKPTGIVTQVITENKVTLRLPNFPGSAGSSVQVNCEGKPFFKVDKVMAVF